MGFQQSKPETIVSQTLTMLEKRYLIHKIKESCANRGYRFEFDDVMITDLHNIKLRNRFMELFLMNRNAKYGRTNPVDVYFVDAYVHEHECVCVQISYRNLMESWMLQIDLSKACIWNSNKADEYTNTQKRYVIYKLKESCETRGYTFTYDEYMVAHIIDLPKYEPIDKFMEMFITMRNEKYGANHFVDVRIVDQLTTKDSISYTVQYRPSLKGETWVFTADVNNAELWSNNIKPETADARAEYKQYMVERDVQLLGNHASSRDDNIIQSQQAEIQYLKQQLNAFGAVAVATAVPVGHIPFVPALESAKHVGQIASAPPSIYMDTTYRNKPTKEKPKKKTSTSSGWFSQATPYSQSNYTYNDNDSYNHHCNDNDGGSCGNDDECCDDN